MAGVEELRKMMEIGLSNANYVMLCISPGIWIDADAFRETENGILFLRKGHSSGFVHKDVFEKITWQLPVENPEQKKED